MNGDMSLNYCYNYVRIVEEVVGYWHNRPIQIANELLANIKTIKGIRFMKKME